MKCTFWVFVRLCKRTHPKVYVYDNRTHIKVYAYVSVQLFVRLGTNICTFI